MAEWKLVPVEPTEAMKCAPRKDRPGFSGQVAREVYQSMLAASQPPAGQQAEPTDEQIEQFAREDAGSGLDLDWSLPENLGATAVQRAAFRRGFKKALAGQQSERPAPAGQAVPICHRRRSHPRCSRCRQEGRDEMITDEQIAAAVRPLYADDTAASMGLADDIRTVRAVLALREQEVSATGAEPVAWRYKDSRGHWRYRGYKANFDVEYSILKPEPLYATPTTSTTGKVDASRVRDEALEEAAQLYGEGEVAAPGGHSQWGDAHQEGWIDGTKAYRDAIRSLIGTPKSAEGEGA